MSVRSPHESPTEDWDGGWEAHEDRQRRSRLQSSPAQRLAWLEQAIAFAHRAGALPRRDAREEDPAKEPDSPAGA